MPVSQRVAQIPWWVSPQPKTKVTPKVKSKNKSKSKVARRRQAYSFFVFVVAATLLTAAVMVNVSEHALIAQDAVELENLKGEVQIEQTSREDLLIQKAALESPERIEAIAVGKIGMVRPAQVDYLMLSEPRDNVKITRNDSFEKGAFQGEMATLPPILGEIVQEIRITTLGDPERDL